MSILRRGGVKGDVIGGASDTSGEVTGHVVKIAGGEVFGNIYGGKGNGGSIQNNIIVLAGGKVSGNIYGSFGNSGNIQDNTIVLAGEANLDNSTLYGHDGGGTGMQNTLRVEVKNEQVQAVQNFDTWHFALPGDLQPSNDPSQPADIMLKVTNQGSALDIDGDRVTVSTDGNLALGLNERAVLLSLEDKQRVTVNYTNPPTTLPTARLDGESAGLPALVYALDTASAPDENQLAIFLEEKYLYGSGGTNTPGQREQGNTLTLTGGEATAAFGGRSNVAGTVSGNTLIIDGAATLKPLDPSHPSYDLSGKAYGGYADTGNATGNTVTLSSNMSGQAAGFALYGGFSGNGGEATSGNTLQVQGSEVTVPAINNFETLSLTLPATTGGAMLTINGGAPTVFSTMLNVGADVAAGAPLLSVGEQFVLLHNPDGLLNGGGGALVQGRDYQKLNPGSGYDFELSNTDTSIIATGTKVPPQPQPPPPQPQ
ncbi:MAG: hypothetical protein IJM64_09635, partial [Ottowia sp.]|nr:hypothetical protein [Ottowia sp.]